MRKTITLTESELIKIIKKIVFNDSVISEVNKVENFNEENPVYRYRDISVLRDDFRPNQIGSVYFMGVTYNGSEYVKPKKGVKVTFTGDKGDFTFNSNDIKITNTNPMIGVGDLTDDYKEKLIPYLKGKDKSSFSNNSINKEKNKDKFTSVEIKRALERAFRDYWVEETDDTTSGLRGIETIGEYLEKEMDYEGDTTEDWSVMNFFNTMTIPELITKKWDNDGRENRRTDWLTGVFKNDTEFLNTLLKTQWSSLYKGIYKIESSALSKLKKAYKGAEFITKQPGSKTDQSSVVSPS